MVSFPKLLNVVKYNDEDFEWYPTTEEIIEAASNDIKKRFIKSCPGGEVLVSVLDCGAGDGRVLAGLTKGKKYAIEKSVKLLEVLPRDIFVVGTDFYSQTLIDKSVEVIFSNPPFSSFEEWACKIVKEGNAKAAYLVMPVRWKKCDRITLALESRNAKSEVIGDFNFYDADRNARGIVQLVRVDLARFYKDNRGVAGEYYGAMDPFNLWFDENFPLKISKEKASETDREKSFKNNLNEKIQSGKELIANDGLVYLLDEFYKNDLNQLMDYYKRFTGIDPILLGELGVNVSSVKGALKLRIESLKNCYWHELIGRLTAITSRLCASSRKAMLEKLFTHTHVDFNADNAHAIVMWAIKNANTYFDSQLIDLVLKITEKANVSLYKSNKKTFKDEEWRYCRNDLKVDRYKLEYRVVITREGGIAPDKWGKIGLSDYAAEFIGDLCTVAYNIGFDTYGLTKPDEKEWSSGQRNEFSFRNLTSGKEEILFDVRAFYNGNLHIRFNQDFICKLNVEFGRLMGWLRSAEEASEELDIKLDLAKRNFNSNLQLDKKSGYLMLTAM